MNKFFIIYHKDDNDGVFSGALLKYFCDKKNFNSEAKGYDYKGLDSYGMEDIKNGKYDFIFMTDICFTNFENFEKLNERGIQVTLMDHHAPKLKALEDPKYNFIAGERTAKHSAIWNTYKWLYGAQIPLLFRYLSAWDSWTFGSDISFEDCRNVNIGVYERFNLDFGKIYDYIKDLLESKTIEEQKQDIEDFKKAGKVINSYLDILNKNALKENGDYSWKVGGKSAAAVFNSMPSSSVIFSSLKGTKYKRGIVFKHNTGNYWTISLYNVNDEDDFDCGEYMENYYGGGGHHGAAGCQMTESEFLKLLKHKKL